MALKLFNDAGTHSTILAASPTTDGVITIPDASGKLAMEKSIGRRNYLINGNFDKWDYGISQTSNGYGSDNRWYNGAGGSTRTHSQVACSDTERALFNAMYFSRTQVTSSSGSTNLVYKSQQIENVNLLAGKTVTLSFWAKADSNKNIAVEFLQGFGTGGNPSQGVVGIGSQLVPLTTTWQKKTITLTLPSIVGKTLGTDGVQTTYTQIQFWFDAGSNYNSRTANLGQQSGTFDIAQVKLEDGLVATDGWHPYDGEFGSEIQACQRYYEVGSGPRNYWPSTSAWVSSSVFFKTKKRVAPTITWSIGGVANKVGVDDSGDTATGGLEPSMDPTSNFSIYVNGTNCVCILFDYTASAEM
jgi:hypothetical protein